MDTLVSSHLIIPFLIAMFLAINMGGSGTAPSFSVAFGSNVIKKNAIPGLFGLMVFLGAIIAGKATAKTVGNGIINPELLNYAQVSIILFAVSISLLIANIFGIPQSTSQATVLAVAAPGFYFKEFSSHTLFAEIIPTWFILPISAFVICLLIAKYIYKPLRRRGYTISSKINDHYMLKGAIIIMSMYVAFSIGANNVANASGPLTTMTMNELNPQPHGGRSLVLLMIMATMVVAPSFGIGSSIFGNKILKNTGKELFLFGRIEAVIIAFISASLLLLASVVKGVPTSLVQLNVGAILGFGVAKMGYKHIFRKTQVRRFFLMWLIAPLIAFGLSWYLTYLADIYGYI
ncbi:MAG: inorganic phosphate transporter [Bacteroidales bacterium]|nr:inorganic phosphate transporter [Bacteroidales bacterium]HPD95075.1 inorganic phosphate transporter [Tenuifilaceae bacterium]HRX30390.1 inorganic phosphate transporter [Tenuifilaceae bacterium]